MRLLDGYLGVAEDRLVISSDWDTHSRERDLRDLPLMPT